MINQEEIEAIGAEIEADYNEVNPQEDQQQKNTPQPDQPGTPKPEAKKPEAAAPKPEEPKQESSGNMVVDAAKKGAEVAKSANEMAMSAAAGTVDFAVDLVNKIPGVDLPKANKFENGLAQAYREMSSFLVPELAAVAAMKKIPTNGFFARPIVNRVGEAAASMGVGAAVGYINKYSEEGDNLTGLAKQYGPSWLADNIPGFHDFLEWVLHICGFLFLLRCRR